MKKNSPPTLAYNPLFRVIVTWVWWLVSAALTVLIIQIIHSVTFPSAMEILEEKPYLAVYIEIVSVGLFPVIFTLFCNDSLAQYGIGRKGLIKSFLFSLLFVGVMYSFAYLSRGHIMSDERPNIFLDFPWNIWYAGLGTFAWGPLEVFFVAWLITNTDKIFKDNNKMISWGLVITVAIFSLTHIPTTSMTNALYTGVIFFVLGIIYKSTGNAIGPMIAWTLINGQVWYIARLLWT